MKFDTLTKTSVTKCFHVFKEQGKHIKTKIYMYTLQYKLYETEQVQHQEQQNIQVTIQIV